MYLLLGAATITQVIGAIIALANDNLQLLNDDILTLEIMCEITCESHQNTWLFTIHNYKKQREEVWVMYLLSIQNLLLHFKKKDWLLCIACI